MAMDKWSTREQLCLASAVSSNGENWPSVSRSLKIVCSASGRGRLDDDCFSQKSCAVQYGQLLESSGGGAEMPKRNKQRTSETTTDASSSVADGLMRRLTADRIQELKEDIRQEQDEYTKIYTELKAMQAGQLSEKQLQAMWADLEQQHETQRIVEMKLENRMREREQRKQEMQQRDWRTAKTAAGSVLGADTPTNAVDKRAGLMDVEEIIGSGRTMFSEVGEITVSQQPQQPAQTGTTAPLLSSLLKSPTTTTPTSVGSFSITAATPVTGGNSARATAPTITTLLTSGSIPNTNQPMITLKSSIPPNEAAQLLARPISGPPVSDALAAAVNATQNLLSPSQSAPTLSMLLEKNKSQSSSSTSSSAMVNSNGGRSIELTIASVSVAVKALDSGNCGPQKSQMSVVAHDSNNEEVPMDIEEDISAAAAAAVIASNSGDFDDEPDDSAEEEQQLMEVFKNIGNIDELDIDVAAVIDDEEVDFLKGVDEELEPPPTEEVINFQDCQQQPQGDSISFAAKNDNANMSSGGGAEIDSMAHLRETMNEVKSKNEEEAKAKAREEIHTNERKTENVKVETIISSSDDSNDNIPLAAVASLESKERGENLQERIFLKEKVESAIKNKGAEPAISVTIEANNNNGSGGDGGHIVESIATAAPDDGRTDFSNAAVELGGADEASTSKSDVVENVNPAQSPPESEDFDVIAIPTDEESNRAKLKLKEQQAAEDKIRSIYHANNKEDETIVESKIQRINESTTYDSALALTNTFEYDSNVPPPPTTTISVVDTDDSSTTDFSINTPKDEPRGLASGKHNVGQQQGKNLQDRKTKSVKADDDSAVAAEATLARTPMLRKLRDRDRSESPMIDDETTTTSDHSTNHRSRRRYSSTPVIDSIPNSPASSERDRDDPRESRTSKRSLMSIYNALHPNRSVGIVLQRAFSENKAYEELCQRPMDLITIKKNIDSGVIRSVSELQRDIMLMCQNAMMLCKTPSATFKAALNLMHECQSIRGFAANPHDTSNSSAARMAVTGKESKGVRVRGSSRKSQRIT